MECALSHERLLGLVLAHPGLSDHSPAVRFPKTLAIVERPGALFGRGPPGRACEVLR